MKNLIFCAIVLAIGAINIVSASSTNKTGISELTIDNVEALSQPEEHEIDIWAWYYELKETFESRGEYFYTWECVTRLADNEFRECIPGQKLSASYRYRGF